MQKIGSGVATGTNGVVKFCLFLINIRVPVRSVQFQYILLANLIVQSMYTVDIFKIFFVFGKVKLFDSKKEEIQK